MVLPARPLPPVDMDVEADVLDEMWGPNGIGSKPENVSFHEDDVPPVLMRPAPPARGPWVGGFGPTTYYRY